MNAKGGTEVSPLLKEEVMKKLTKKKILVFSGLKLMEIIGLLIFTFGFYYIGRLYFIVRKLPMGTQEYDWMIVEPCSIIEIWGIGFCIIGSITIALSVLYLWVYGNLEWTKKIVKKKKQAR